MRKGEWTFLTNHARILGYIAKHPQATAQEIAQEASLSIRGVQNIITDLANGGYITKQREGRHNRYTVHADQSMRHPLERDHTVGEGLALGSLRIQVEANKVK